MNKHLGKYLYVAMGALLVLWLIIAALVPPANHYLATPRVPNSPLSIAEYEATYFGYLAGLTIPTIGAILGMLVLTHKGGKWQLTALVAMYAFCVAIFFVTVGYAIRVAWVGGVSLPDFVVGIDASFNGPVTAFAYVVGVIGLAVLAFLGPPKIDIPKTPHQE